MKKLLLSAFLVIGSTVVAQLQVDTLAIQTFDSIPMNPPVWTFTGPVVYNSGFSGASAAPSNSPLGIGGSRAWETTLNSGGLVLIFSNITIPAGYDSIRFRFNLAAMNLTGTSGGPDDLDYVLTEISTNAGSTYYARLRNRGAIANNSFWPYSATGYSRLYYQPQTEVVFQPTNSGLQTTEGYSTNEIVFPGNLTQVMIRMTGRSSTSTDTWLVDNVVLTGEKNGTTGIIQGAQYSIRAYPNPAQDKLNISVPSTGVIEVLDVLGESKCSFELAKGNNVLDISSLVGGTYLLKINYEGGTSFKRIVVTK